MNSKLKVALLCILTSFMMVSCGEKKTSSSTQSSSSTQQQDYEHKSVEVKEYKTSCMKGSGRILAGGKVIAASSSYLKNPATYDGKNASKNVIKTCPVGELTDKMVFYTPDGWLRKPSIREDANVLEYLVRPVDEVYKNGVKTPVYEIVGMRQEAETVVPVDGIVISVPLDFSSDASLFVGQKIEFDGFDFNTYVSGIYSENGRRVPIKSVNPTYMPYAAANLFDVSADTKVVWGNKRLNTIMFEYDDASSSFKATEFNQKVHDNDLKVPTDGFMLANEVISANPLSLLLEKGVIFDEGQKVYLENPVGLFDEKIIYKIGYQGTYTDENGNVKNIDPNVEVATTNKTFSEWGYEFSIVDGKVNDGAVNLTHPSNGYRVHFYNDRIEDHIATFKNQFRIGASVSYNANEVILDYNLPNFAPTYLKRLEDNINSYIAKHDENLYDINVDAIKEIKTKFQENVQYLNSIKLDTETEKYYYQNRVNYAKYLADQAYLYSAANEPVETRSIWYYPLASSYTIDSITTSLKQIRNAGFNEVILSSSISEINNYGLVYKSQYAAIAPSVASGSYGKYKDYMDAFVTIAHKEGLKVQVCTATWFFYQAILDKDSSFADCFATNYDGTNGTDSSGEITKFFDPANPKVRDLYLDMTKELLNNYDIDGIHLDYIRYGAGNDGVTTSQGFTQAALDGFKAEYPTYSYINDLTQFKNLIRTNSSMFNDFNNFRRNVITKFVASTRDLAKGKQLTIAVVSNVDAAKYGKLQDWKVWLENNYIDSIHLMAYYCDSGFVKKDSKVALEHANGKSYVVTGISPIFSNLEMMTLPEEIEGARSTGVQGTALFASHSFGNRPELGEYLNGENGRGVYNTQAIATYEKTEMTTKVFVEKIKERIANIYKRKGSMTSSQESALIKDLDALLATKNNTESALIKINEMVELAKVNTYGTNQVKDRVLETLEYMQSIYRVKVHKTL